MDRKKKEIFITVILGVILLIAISMNLKRLKSTKKTTETPLSIEKPATEVSSKSIKANADVIALQKQRANLVWGRDPFFFTQAKKVYTGQKLFLKGISLGKDGKGYVFVNDQILTVGDVVGGYKVMEIKKDRVLLKKGSDTFYLGLPEE